MHCTECGNAVPKSTTYCPYCGHKHVVAFRARRLPLGNMGIVLLCALAAVILWVCQQVMAPAYAGARTTTSWKTFGEQAFLNESAHALYREGITSMMASMPMTGQGSMHDLLTDHAVRITAREYARLSDLNGEAALKPYAYNPLLVGGALASMREDSWGEYQLLLISEGSSPYVVAELEGTLAQTLMLEQLKPGGNVELLCRQSLLPHDARRLAECHLVSYQMKRADMHMHRHIPTNANMLDLVEGQGSQTLYGRMLCHAAAARLTIASDPICAVTVDDRCRMRFAHHLSDDKALVNVVRQHYKVHGFNADQVLVQQRLQTLVR